MTNGKTKKKMTVPSSYVIIFSVIVLIAILTWFIPAIKHATLGMTLMAPIHGFKNGVSVILFILIIGGYLRIVNETKSLEVGIGSIVKRLKGREVWMIPVIMFIISLGGTTYGLSDEALPIYPLLISAMLACGFDSVTATATILCGIISGVSGSTINPFSISAAIDALKETGIQPNQGIILGMGTVVWLSSYLISCLYTMRYALRVKKDPSRSVQSAAERQQAMEIFGKETEAAESMELTPAMKKTLKLFGLSFAIMILGLVPWQAYQIHCFDGWSAFLTGTPLGKWYFNELCVWFLVMSFVIGFFNHFDSRKIMKLFVAGAGDLVGAALIVGLSRGVSAIMKDTGFNTYLLQVGTQALSGVPSALFSSLSYIFYSGFTFLITSTSGLASATIPTMGALTHSLGYAPEVMITIYIAAHHIVGVIPTSGTIMGALNVCKIEYTTWVKFYGKLFLIISLWNLLLTGVAMVAF